MKRNCINHYFLLTVLGALFLSINTNAQIESIQVDGTTRSMLVYAPSGIEQDRPLLLSLHGLNQDINYQQNQTQWESVADDHNFVVVYPGGIDNSWDISGTSDVDFILAIIDEMYDRYGIDRDRVYLSGFSMGGMMTYHAANHIADKIAAFAPVSGYLMGGPDTNSTRPIPIIHTHGTADDVVPYSGVQTCLDAWIARNDCPTTAQVTDPYPADKTSSNGTKYYWGPGTDDVEIVLLSLEGNGHWHSLDPNGVHTSQEIWNFCKKFTLNYGVPEFEFAAVTDDNPKQIQVDMSKAIADSNYFNGFTVKVDSQVVTIDSVVLADTNQLVINLGDSILKDHKISLSYGNGNVYSLLGKELVGFTDTLVDNLLKGSSPRLIELTTTKNGDTLKAKFNKNMQLPSVTSAMTLNAEYNGSFGIPILQSSFSNNDSTILSFSLDEQVYADYELLLSYSGDDIVSSDSGFLETISDFPVTNNAKGLPVHIDTGKIGEDGTTIALGFTKPMAITDGQVDYFTFKVNNESVPFEDFFLLNNTISFILSNNLHYDDTLTVSYSPGDVTAEDKGPLEEFSDFAIVNPLNEPNWPQIPGKIEAENFTLQSGIETEQTSDTGGGLNVGWIDNDDWLEYAIENTSSDTLFEMAFRVASQNGGGRFYLNIDNAREAIMNVPNTGGWQTWETIVNNVTIGPGKHYIKLVAATGGFNVNYMEIKQIEETGTPKVNNDQVNIYPNPVSNEIIIRASGFEYNKIEIFDMMGKTVLKRLTEAYIPEFHMPVSLPNGMYIIKISSENEYQLNKIIIAK